MRLYTTSQGIAKAIDDETLALLDLPYADIGALLTEDPELKSLASAGVIGTLPLSDAQVLAPILRPSKIICMSANYHSHLDDEVAGVLKMLNPDSGDEEIQTLKETPTFFGVPSSAICGPTDPIRLPAIAPNQVDYEVEVAVVIGKGGKDLPIDQAWKHIAGLTLSNDVSARDLQGRAMRTHFFELGHAKGLDTFKPLGPCLVTRDEFSLPLDLAIETKVNGEVRQSARTSGMVHSVESSISQVSRYFTLFPGDVILTGSPSGVGFFQDKYLKYGDVVEMSAEGIGKIRNEVVHE